MERCTCESRKRASESQISTRPRSTETSCQGDGARHPRQTRPHSPCLLQRHPPDRPPKLKLKPPAHQCFGGYKENQNLCCQATLINLKHTVTALDDADCERHAGWCVLEGSFGCMLCVVGSEESQRLANRPNNPKLWQMTSSIRHHSRTPIAFRDDGPRGRQGRSTFLFGHHSIDLPCCDWWIYFLFFLTPAPSFPFSSPVVPTMRTIGFLAVLALVFLASQAQAQMVCSSDASCSCMVSPP